MHVFNESNVFILFHFLWGCYGGALVFLGGAGAPASPSLAPPMDLENTFINTPSRVLLKELDAARSALNQILTRKASLLFARQRLYEYGNKPGRLLARLAWGRNEASMISSLKDGNGSLTHDSKQINTIMRVLSEVVLFRD